MAIESEFRELFSESVKLLPRTGIDKYGKPTYGSAASVPAHFMGEITLLPTAEGRERVQTGVVFIYGTPTCDTNYGMELVSGERVVILSVDEAWDQVGPHHLKIRYGRGG